VIHFNILKNLLYDPREHFWGFYGSQNKQPLFPYTALTDWSL